MADQSDQDQEQESLHIVMFPWLAFGHLIPFLELSKCLAQKGHRISFVTTPRNIQRLPKISPNLLASHLITFVSIPLPQTPNLQPEAEATIDLPLDHIPYLKQAYDALEAPLSAFLTETSNTPDWIIHDFVPYWLPPIATRLGIPSVYLSLFNASFNVFFGPPSEVDRSRAKPEQFTSPPDWIPFPNNLAFRPYEMIRLSANIEQNVSGVTDVFRMAATIQGCDLVAIRSSMEIESEWFYLLEHDVFQKPVVPVGLIPPSGGHEETTENNNKNEESWIGMTEWLDKQESKSVVYVALGTEATLSQYELTELALGLELSELPFFWVLRKPAGGSTDEHPSDLLPDGFKERTRERGFICTIWAPQTRIVEHPSVGCFLTHCGWGSTIEGLLSGCPFVLLPFINDQAIVARLLVWKKMGLEIERDEEDGSFNRESVAKSLRIIVVEEEGKAYRCKARELRGVLGDEARLDKYVGILACRLVEQGRRRYKKRSSE